jgi:copper oxidase (laccase) domain-containing protein
VTVPFETFPALAALPGIVHAFTLRVPGLDVRVERDVALARLESAQAEMRAQLDLGTRRFLTAEQVHGARVAVVDAATSAPVAAVDGLLTADRQVCLGIHVADCGPVFLVDPTRQAIALLHSGRKGTEQGITTAAIRLMGEKLGCDPAHLVVLLGPCIRPPRYEVDFAAEILRQARAAGVRQVFDCGRCTGADLSRYYSYRMEKGRTGRLLALLALR